MPRFLHKLYDASKTLKVFSYFSRIALKRAMRNGVG
jgi:hypothetical protein